MSKNSYLLAFLRRMEARYSVDAQSMGMAEWICLNTTIRGKPFSFSRYPFQRQIADDMHPALVCEKLSQVGLTEVQVRKALATVRRRSQDGISAMFTLADDKMFDKVTSTRVKPIIESDGVFNLDEDAKAIRNKSTYQFGRSFLYMTGSTESDATSTAVDFMFNDEIDLTNQDILATFASRLQGSDYRVRQQFSTPTYTGFGVNAMMGLSDYHEYMMKCGSCGHHQVPTFSRQFCHIPGLPMSIESLMDIDDSHIPHLDLGNAYVKCERCQKALDLDSVELREWVAKHPGRPYRGYKVRPFSTSRLDLLYLVTQLCDFKRKNKLRRFNNTVLGEADDGGNARLSYEDIAACFGRAGVPEIGGLVGIFVGIDVGQICTVTLGVGTCEEDVTPFHVFFIHVDNLEAKVKEICTRYRVVAGAIDRHPYEPTAQAIFKASGEKIWPVEYRGTKELFPVKDAEKKITHWQVDRTTHLDQVAARVRSRNMVIEGYGDLKEVITEHLRNMVREEEPETPATWKKLDENDHFFHSAAFMMTATKLPHLISLINQEDVRATVGILPITTPAPALILPGFSPNQRKPSRIITTQVYR